MNQPDQGQLDPAVVASLVAQHGDELHRFLWGVLRDAQLAQDVMQTALAKMVELGHTTEAESRKAWLFRVALNEAYRVRRRQTTGDGILRKIAWQRELVQPGADFPAIQQETIELVRTAVNELPPEQKQVVLMRVYENKTFATIADELQIPLGTALSRMRLALSKLRSRLEN